MIMMMMMMRSWRGPIRRAETSTPQPLLPSRGAVGLDSGPRGGTPSAAAPRSESERPKEEEEEEGGREGEEKGEKNKMKGKTKAKIKMKMKKTMKMKLKVKCIRTLGEHGKRVARAAEPEPDHLRHAAREALAKPREGGGEHSRDVGRLHGKQLGYGVCFE